MATIIKNPAVTETKVVEVSPATVTLTLSLEEAGALRAALSHIAGNAPLSSLYAILGDKGFPEYLRDHSREVNGYPFITKGKQ